MVSAPFSFRRDYANGYAQGKSLNHRGMWIKWLTGVVVGIDLMGKKVGVIDELLPPFLIQFFTDRSKLFYI